MHAYYQTQGDNGATISLSGVGGGWKIFEVNNLANKMTDSVANQNK